MAICVMVYPLSATPFSDFLIYLGQSEAAQREALVDSFMNTISRTPLIECDTTVHLIYRGNSSVYSVSVPGDMNGWTPGVYAMQRAANTTLWYFSHVFESDARLDYKFVTNGSNWILDPRNPFRCTGGYGPNSELRMPDFIQPPEISYYPQIPHGAVFDTVLYSPQLNNSRHVRVYTPPGYENGTAEYSLVLFHDGLEYLSLAYANNVLDYLIAGQQIEPLIGVFVPPVNRTAEYAGSQQQAFTAFIAQTVVQWIDSRYRTRTDSRHRLIAGASNGGNIALWIALQHPELFGRVAAFSSNVQTNITDRLNADPLLDLSFYLDIGTYDIDALIPLVTNLRSILIARGYPLLFQEFHEGHSWGNWRAHIDDALRYFFPPATSLSNSGTLRPATFRLYAGYPNPFNDRITIRFDLQHNAQVKLVIYDLNGRIVTTLVETPVPAGSYHYEWITHGIASGCFLAGLTIDGATQWIKIVHLK